MLLGDANFDDDLAQRPLVKTVGDTRLVGFAGPNDAEIAGAQADDGRHAAGFVEHREVVARHGVFFKACGGFDQQLGTIDDHLDIGVFLVHLVLLGVDRDGLVRLHVGENAVGDVYATQFKRAKVGGAQECESLVESGGNAGVAVGVAQRILDHDEMPFLRPEGHVFGWRGAFPVPFFKQRDYMPLSVGFNCEQETLVRRSRVEDWYYEPRKTNVERAFAPC